MVIMMQVGIKCQQIATHTEESDMTNAALPRPEYPRPQFQRADWLCLNGAWEFEDDPGDSGEERGVRGRALKREITVPFCRESQLSGIGDPDRVLAVWYRRRVTVPAAWTGRETWLHFQAADYDTTVWVDGVEVGRHRGGFTTFSLPLHGVEAGQPIEIVVRCRDDWFSRQPRGKQAQSVLNGGCHYLRTTGIWQSVWLEPLAKAHLRRPRLTPDLANCRLRCVLPVSSAAIGCRVEAELTDAAGVVTTAACVIGPDLAPSLDLTVPESRLRLWSPEDPHLYGVRLRLVRDGKVVDAVDSYAGMRAVAIDGARMLLNGKPRFQRLVLDQGLYPDGILTAPSDAALVRDIELSMQAGFNGARLHQKVFEERFLYHADRLGYLVWGEFGDWWQDGSEHGVPEAPVNGAAFVSQWLEAVERDLSHPAIIGWCPLNETFAPRRQRLDVMEDMTQAMYRATKLIDPSRPVIDASGWLHRVDGADVYDLHEYEQDPAKFAARVDDVITCRAPATMFENDPKRPNCVPYRGQPFMVSEFGGARWDGQTPAEGGWGYGNAPCTENDFQQRFAYLCAAMLGDSRIFGYCYTQLTDVFQEVNGVYRFDRSCKLDIAKLRAAQLVPAAIEG